MHDRLKIQGYINNFRRHFAPFLRPGIGLRCVVSPVIAPGAILEFTVGPNTSSADEFKAPVETVNIALWSVRQNAFGGDLGVFHFQGTNTLVDNERIVLIKGSDDESLWSDAGAAADVKRIVGSVSRPEQGARLSPP